MSGKFTFVISKRLEKMLERESKKLGLNKSEIVRRALAKEFEKRGFING